MKADELRGNLRAGDPTIRAAARAVVRKALVATDGDFAAAALETGLEVSEVLQWGTATELPWSAPPSEASGKVGVGRVPSSVDLAKASGSPFDDFGPQHKGPLGLTSKQTAIPELSMSEPALESRVFETKAEVTSKRTSPSKSGSVQVGPIRPHTPKATQQRLPPLHPEPKPKQRRLALILHAHLPWVLGHGTWPHGEEWLMEAVVHCYVPLIAMLQRLEAKGKRNLLTFSVTPVLACQLADTRTKAAVDRYYSERLAAAETLQENHPLGSWWNLQLLQSRNTWEAVGGDLVGALSELERQGAIELSTCAATHAYLPLCHREEMIRFQIAAGIQQHEKLFGRKPRGLWMPECAYRPEGSWQHPVTGAAESFRSGNEQFLEEQGITWTVVDAHHLLGGEPFLGYGFPWVDDPRAVTQPLPDGVEDNQTLGERLQPTWIGQSRVAAMVREPHSARQVWARHLGYPGDPRFLDFHKRDEATGFRLWSVTDAEADLADKLPYWPHAAADAVADQAQHFIQMIGRVPGLGDGVAACPFDAELFGHWWYEGPQWLEAVLESTDSQLMVETTTPELELNRIPAARRENLLEGSWGEEGDHRVWVNSQTDWMWTDLRQAENAVHTFITDNNKSRELCRAVLAQLALMASSDWPFLITMGAAGDYATLRFERHRDRLHQLLSFNETEVLPDWAILDLRLMDLDRDWWSKETLNDRDPR